MDMDSVECLSLPDASMDVDDVDSHHHHHHHNLPLHPAHLAAGGTAARAFPKVNAGAGAGAGAVGVVGALVGAAGGPPATSVHELLECPVCTNSMFPPIHQITVKKHWDCPFIRGRINFMKGMAMNA